MTKWACDVNGREYEIDIPDETGEGVIYFDAIDDRLVYRTMAETPTVDPARYMPLVGFKPKAARAAHVRAAQPTTPRNRAERRRHLALVRRGEDPQ